MPNVIVTLPEDDTTADVGDYNVPILAILAVLNGHLDADNIEPGSLPWSVMDNFTNSIPAGAMQDNANLEKYRLEGQFSFIADGALWTATSGLGASMTAGVVYSTNGQRVVVDSVSNRIFTASRDTYIDIAPNGSVDYTEVMNDANAPGLVAGYLRIALVTTSASAVTGVHLLGKRNQSNEIGRFTAGATVGRMAVQNIPPRKHLTIRATLLTNNNTLDTRALFNNDTSNIYDCGIVNNEGSAYGTQANGPSLSLDQGTNNPNQFVEIKTSNIATRQKVGTVTNVTQNSAGSPPQQRTLYFQYRNATDAINRVDIFDNGSGFAPGSEIIVYGDD